MLNSVKQLGAIQWMAGVITLGSVMAFASSDDSQLQVYQAIVTRNAFGLHPPIVAPPPSDVTTSAPPVNIVLTGISYSRGVKKAYFMIPAGDKPNVFSYPIIQEKGKQDGLEVIEINEKQGVVKVAQAGSVRTLNFKENGNKAVGFAMAPPPGMPGAPGGMPGAPGAKVLPLGMPGAPTMNPAPTPINVPPTPVINRGAGIQGSPSTVPVTTTPAQAIPSRPVRGAQNTAVPNDVQYSQSIINVEVQRAMNADKIAKGEFPPLPPTELSDETAH